MKVTKDNERFEEEFLDRHRVLNKSEALLISIITTFIAKGLARLLILDLVTSRSRDNIVFDTSLENTKTVEFYSNKYNISRQRINIEIKKLVNNHFIRKVDNYRYLASPYFFDLLSVSKNKREEIRNLWATL